MDPGCIGCSGSRRSVGSRATSITCSHAPPRSPDRLRLGGRASRSTATVRHPSHRPEVARSSCSQAMITVAFDPAETPCAEITTDPMATTREAGRRPVAASAAHARQPATRRGRRRHHRSGNPVTRAGLTMTLLRRQSGKIAPMYAAFEFAYAFSGPSTRPATAGLDVTKPHWERTGAYGDQAQVGPSRQRRGRGHPISFPILDTIFDFEGGAPPDKRCGSSGPRRRGDLDAVGEFGSPKPLRFDEWLTLMIRGQTITPPTE